MIHIVNFFNIKNQVQEENSAFVVSLPQPTLQKQSKKKGQLHNPFLRTQCICQSTMWTFNDWRWDSVHYQIAKKKKKKIYEIPNYTSPCRHIANICTHSFLQNWTPLNTTRSTNEKQRLVTFAMSYDFHLFLIRGCTLWPRIIFGRVFKRVLNCVPVSGACTFHFSR